MASFQQYARLHNALADKHNELCEAHDETRAVVQALVNAHNHFVSMSLWQRVKCVLFGDTKPPRKPEVRRREVTMRKIDDEKDAQQ